MPPTCMCPALACYVPPLRTRHATSMLGQHSQACWLAYDCPGVSSLSLYDCSGTRSLVPCGSPSQTAACRLQGSAQALIGLLEACEAVLPQARRARLAREARRHAVARSRARQKSGGRCSFQLPALCLCFADAQLLLAAVQGLFQVGAAAFST